MEYALFRSRESLICWPQLGCGIVGAFEYGNRVRPVDRDLNEEPTRTIRRSLFFTEGVIPMLLARDG